MVAWLSCTVGCCRVGETESPRFHEASQGDVGPQSQTLPLPPTNGPAVPLSARNSGTTQAICGPSNTLTTEVRMEVLAGLLQR